MDLKDVAALLGWKREEVVIAIETGMELPQSKKRIKLLTNTRNGYDIDENDLDVFIAAFEDEEPGRHPPVGVRRTLLVEASHRCAICGDPAPLQFHHIVEFSKLKHHDPKFMFAVCGTCHDKIHLGHIDNKAQLKYKDKIRERGLFPIDFPARFTWDDLQEIITALHNELMGPTPSTESKYDFSVVSVERKNELNRLGEHYFAMMRDHHEPYFGRIEKFLKNPINIAVANFYHEVVDELCSKIAVGRTKFESFEAILMQVRDSAKDSPELKNKRSTLNILLSFMYFQCDIGRKV